MSGRGQWYMRGLAVLVVLGLLGWGGYQIQRDEVMPVQTLQLQGVFQRVDAEQLKRVVVANMTGNFFTLDMQRLHRAVAALPWVQEVQVDRTWPGLLRVRIREQQPAALWNGTALLNENGEIFLRLDAQQAARFDLPRLAGPDDLAGQVLARYRDFAGALAPLSLQLSALALDRRRSWSLQLGNGMRVMLGRKNTSQRLSRFLAVYAKYFQGQALQPRYVDLRYANGFAVDWGETHGAVPLGFGQGERTVT